VSRRLPRAAVTSSRRLLQALYTGIALFGVLVAPPVTTLAVGFAFGVAGAVLFAVIHWSCREQEPAPRAILTAGTTGAALVPFAEGISALGDAGTALSLGLLILSTVLGGHWLATLDLDPPATTTTQHGAGAGAGGHPIATGVAEDPSLPELLRVLPLDALFTEWRATENELDAHQGGQRYAATVHIRGLLLEEMRHRDPAGVQRWLSSGARGRPEHYIHGDHDLTA
jgi:hypothetical protein